MDQFGVHCPDINTYLSNHFLGIGITLCCHLFNLDVAVVILFIKKFLIHSHIDNKALSLATKIVTLNDSVKLFISTSHLG